MRASRKLEAQRLAVVAATIVVLQQVLRNHGLADDIGAVDDDDTVGFGLRPGFTRRARAVSHSP